MTDPREDSITPQAPVPQPRKPKHHVIKSAWVRRPLKMLLGVIIFVLLLPVLIYIPPVQTLLKDAACRIVARSTGMDVSIERFRLRFPLDVQLDGVRIIEASGDTMVTAGSLIADVKMRPLLHMDAQVNKLELQQATYRMVSADSSMTLRLRAGLLRTQGGTDFNLKDMHLKLKGAELQDALVRVDMDVWKQQKDTTYTPTKFLIEADSLALSNVTYSMSMLPTIDDLSVNIGKGKVKGARINLTDNNIRIEDVVIASGTAEYLTPTSEYLSTHPAPQDTVPSPGPPMTVEIGRAQLQLSRAVYATRGAVPVAGFDPSYIEVSDVAISARDFYNQAATLRLPVESMQATERSGLQITSGSGLLAINATGLTLNNFAVTTPVSSMQASAWLPFELMAMQSDAPAGDVNASGTLAWSDIYAFMPTLRSMISRYLPAKTMAPLQFSLEGAGTMSQIDIERLKLSMGRFVDLTASGRVANFMTPARLDADVKLDGSMRDPSATMQMLQKIASLGSGFKVPSFTLKGTASARGSNYKADMKLLTSAGNVGARGSVAIDAERYKAHVELSDLQVGHVMPSLGIGVVSGTVEASGRGFNPLHPHALAEVKANLSKLTYNGNALAPLTLEASVERGEYDVWLDARAPHFNLTLDGQGHVKGATYYADVTADINYLDLTALGFMKDTCRGSGRVSLRGNANPDDMLFDLDLSVDDVDWEYADEFYSLPHAIDAAFLATTTHTQLNVKGDGLDIDFSSPSPLMTLMGDVMGIMPTIESQWQQKQIDFETLQPQLPRFDLSMDASGSGLLAELLDGTGYSLQSFKAEFSNSDRIEGNARLLQAGNASVTLDTVTLALSQRGKMLDYRVHLGNAPGNLPEFAQVNATGYVGGNRASLFVRQMNAAGEVGYRLGLTAAMQDSVLSLHFTPTKAVIGYKNWVVNDDNYVALGPGKRVSADLEASSGASSIAMHTTSSKTDSVPALDVDIRNLLIQDFLQLSAFAPPVTGAIDSKMHLVYRGSAVTGDGGIGVRGLTYDGTRVGDLDFNFKAGMNFNGNVGASLGLLLNKREVLRGSGFFIADSVRGVKQQAQLKVKLMEFPLDVANPFIGPDMARLSGYLNGDMVMTGSLTAPVLNGTITCDSVGVYVPMAASRFRFDANRAIEVKDNTLDFTDFRIYGANDNPVAINGVVDARNLSDIRFDLSVDGQEVALVNNSRRAGSDIYGQLYVTLGATARGNMSRMNIDGNLSILPATNIFYTMAMASSGSLTQESTTDVVKFVQFSDTIQTAAADSLTNTSMAMRINAALNIVSGAQVTVNLSNNGTDKVQLSPSGNLSFVQTYMGDRRLNGTITLGEGMARYTVKVLGEKTFVINPASFVTWTGDLMNPQLNISATDHVKANVQQEGANSRLIYFDVLLKVLGTLSSPQVSFDLSTDDDITVQNELQGMTPEQRSASAINLLLYNTYTGPGVKASGNLAGNPLYSILESQLNSLAAKYVPGVDLSFGIDQYDKTVDGQTSGTTSYSYQVSKSLFDNRFKIVVGGNYSTDANADENFAQNLISDISFEYSLKQTATTSLLVRLFRHTGFESILEGEVTETGAGLVMKRKLSNLRSLFRFGGKRRREVTDTTSSDTNPAPAPRWQKVQLPADANTTDSL